MSETHAIFTHYPHTHTYTHRQHRHFTSSNPRNFVWCTEVMEGSVHPSAPIGENRFHGIEMDLHFRQKFSLPYSTQTISLVDFRWMANAKCICDMRVDGLSGEWERECVWESKIISRVDDGIENILEMMHCGRITKNWQSLRCGSALVTNVATGVNEWNILA